MQRNAKTLNMINEAPFYLRDTETDMIEAVIFHPWFHTIASA